MTLGETMMVRALGNKGKRGSRDVVVYDNEFI
jgi:hypothetical protein